MSANIPLVLIPGTLCDAALWRHQIDHLGDIAQVSVADHTRHDSMAEIARAILAEAPPRFALAGLSMGGFVAFEIMRQAPERVDRLALLDTSARPDPPEMVQRRRDLTRLTHVGQFKGVTPRLLPSFIHPSQLADQALSRIVTEMAERVGPEAFVRQQTANAARPDSRPDLARIACPTLIVCGRQDILTPLELSGEMAQAIPNATLVVIEDCAHLPTLERPQAATALLRYWLLRP
ncbi:MAG: alpha/beta fold hydrolase [Alphaproteobacteria bacterium]